MLRSNRVRTKTLFAGLLFIANIGLSSLFPVVSSALSPEQKRLYNINANYHEYAVCGDTNDSSDDLQAGTGAPGGTTFPNLDPGAMAAGINDYIEEANPSSKMKGLGETIVKGAQKSNINPFLIVAIAQKESSLSAPGDYNVSHGNNSFGRTATSSQPHFQGARTWYKWSSVKASVDPDASENKNTRVGDIAAYLRNSNFYDKALDSNDLTKMMTTYAPPSENDTAKYVQDIKTWTKKMIRYTKNNGGNNSSGASNDEDSKGVNYDNTDSKETNYEVSVESDGADGSASGDGNYQSGTSYGHKLGWKTHFVAMYPGWAKKNGLKLGDVVKIVYKGKTVYAIYGDNAWVDNSNKNVHTEVSLSVKRAFLGDNASVTTGFGSKRDVVKFTAYPNTHQKIHGEPPSNDLIARVGKEASGGDSNKISNDSCCLTENSSTNLPGRNPKEKIWNFLVNDLKLNDKQAAGVMGNMEQESGFNPRAENPDSGAYGIAQWYAKRKTNLQNFAKSKGKTISNLGVQLEFLKKELEGDYKSSVYEPLKNASSVAEATRVWLEKFEVPCVPGPACDPEMNKRLPNAQDFLRKYGNGAADTSSSSSDDAPACSGESNSGGVDGVSWPVKKSFWDQHQDWFTKPHHDHPSADIPVPSGTKVFSMVDGKVTIAGNAGECGIMVEVEYKDDKDIKIGYCHGTPGSLKVNVGDNVTSGQLVMLSDNTGSSTGPHLHVQIHVNGQIRCPQQAFKDLGANKAVNFKGLASSGCTN